MVEGRIQRVNNQQWFADTYNVVIGSWEGEAVFTGSYPACRKEAVTRAKKGENVWGIVTDCYEVKIDQLKWELETQRRAQEAQRKAYEDVEDVELTEHQEYCFQKMKKRILEGGSEIFNHWRECTGLEVEPFFKELRYMYAEPAKYNEEGRRIANRALGISGDGVLVRLEYIMSRGKFLNRKRWHNPSTTVYELEHFR